MGLVRAQALFGLATSVFMQQCGDKLHLVAYGSKKLTHAERKYSTIEKESLAVI